MLKSGTLYCTRKGLDFLASLDKYDYKSTRNKITKQLAFLNISCTPSLKIIAQIFDQVNYYHRFPFLYVKDPFIHNA